MRWFMLLIFGAFCGVAQLGCGHVAYTEADIAHQQRHTAEMNAKELSDDIDVFLMMDRPSRLTPWQVDK
jgi:hypothetical protein